MIKRREYLLLSLNVVRSSVRFIGGQITLQNESKGGHGLGTAAVNNIYCYFPIVFVMIMICHRRTRRGRNININKFKNKLFIELIFIHGIHSIQY